MIGTYTREMHEQLKQLIALSIVYMLVNARGTAVSFTSTTLFKYLPDANELSRKLASYMHENRKVSLWFYGEQVKYFVSILMNKGIVNDVIEYKDKRGRVVRRRYVILKDKNAELWQLAKTNPDLAIRYLIDVMSDGE